MKEKTLPVSAIKEGTVIDHIEAGNGLKIVKLLHLLTDHNKMTIGLNLKSSSIGLKDLIKIENTRLTPPDTEQIAIFAPLATVNVIENYKVVLKFSIPTPQKIENTLQCTNPKCITTSEPCCTLFFIEEKNQKTFLRCHFCEKLLSRKEVIEKRNNYNI